MYCPECGTKNDEGSLHCMQCGKRLVPAAQPVISPVQPVPVQQGSLHNTFPGLVQIPNYMTQSILITIFCCMPLGIIGIFKANKVNRLLALHDYDGARQASNENKTLLWVGFGVGLVISVLYIVGSINK
jgi:hypothetical protein